MDDTFIAENLEANIGGPAICFMHVSGKEQEVGIVAVDRKRRLFKYLTSMALEEIRLAKAMGQPTEPIRKNPFNHKVMSFDEIRRVELFY
jgi:3-polyprenyl-4-hydroxybenzoate decarboxylase